MQDQSEKTQDVRSIIGRFTEAWNAQGALEDLKFAGFNGRLHYHEHKDTGHPDDTKEWVAPQELPIPEEPLDSQNHFSVDPAAEEYFAESREKKDHIVIIEAHADWDKAIDILRLHHGQVEVRNGSFFEEVSEEERKSVGESYQQPPRIHPTQAIERPRDAGI